MISWAKRPHVWKSVAALIVLACAALAYQGVSNLVSAKSRLAELRAANQKLADESRVLYRKVTRLRSDPRAVEQACRSKMGLVRPDEVVYQTPAPVKSAR